MFFNQFSFSHYNLSNLKTIQWTILWNLDKVKIKKYILSVLSYLPMGNKNVNGKYIYNKQLTIMLNTSGVNNSATLATSSKFCLKKCCHSVSSWNTIINKVEPGWTRFTDIQINMKNSLVYISTHILLRKIGFSNDLSTCSLHLNNTNLDHYH